MLNYESIMSNYKNLTNENYEFYLKQCPHLFTFIWLIKEEEKNYPHLKHSLLNNHYIVIQADPETNYLPDAAELMLESIFNITDYEDDLDDTISKMIKINRNIIDGVEEMNRYFNAIVVSDNILGDGDFSDHVATIELHFDVNFMYYFVKPIFDGKFDNVLKKLHSRNILNMTLNK